MKEYLKTVASAIVATAPSLTAAAAWWTILTALRRAVR